jgi:hypothetical protein
MESVQLMLLSTILRHKFVYWCMSDTLNELTADYIIEHLSLTESKYLLMVFRTCCPTLNFSNATML